MELVQLSTDPGQFRRELNLVAEELAGERVGPQGIEGAGRHGRVRFLVVEEEKRAAA